MSGMGLILLLLPTTVFIWCLSFFCFVSLSLCRRSTYDLAFKVELRKIITNNVFSLKIPIAYLLIGNVLCTILLCYCVNINAIIYGPDYPNNFFIMLIVLNLVSFSALFIGHLISAYLKN